MDISPQNNIFASAAGASSEVWKLLKKEEKKGKSRISDAIRKYHLAHQQVKQELAKSLSEETGLNIEANSNIVENAIFSISLGRIFENRDGEESLQPDLKVALQYFDSESEGAKQAVARQLSKGSEQEVPANHELVEKDINEICLHAVDNPQLIG
ncbi:MAG: hypothetical protein LBQ83_04770 [Candidatus Margulisbacteria bacterium]|jgi:hypothetical protein|nr:hypothetical protein [Candidatus Margulisiibacteriota bacterium]